MEEYETTAAKLASYGMSLDLIMRGETYGILRYLNQNVYQFRLGKLDRPSNRDAEAWLAKEGFEKIIKQTKVLRAYALNDYISDEAAQLRLDSLDSFNKANQVGESSGNSDKTKRDLYISINDVFPFSDVDKIVNSMHGEEDIREYAKEHGRILAGEDRNTQILHVESGTGQNIKPIVRKEANANLETEKPSVSSNRQIIRDLINSFTNVSSSGMELQSEME